jgi:hypothetical protein
VPGRLDTWQHGECFQTRSLSWSRDGHRPAIPTWSSHARKSPHPTRSKHTHNLTHQNTGEMPPSFIGRPNFKSGVSEAAPKPVPFTRLGDDLQGRPLALSVRPRNFEGSVSKSTPPGDYTPLRRRCMFQRFNSVVRIKLKDGPSGNELRPVWPEVTRETPGTTLPLLYPCKIAPFTRSGEDSPEHLVAFAGWLGPASVDVYTPWPDLNL